MKYYIGFWKRAFDFKGVASRKQYWMAVLFNAIILFIISFIMLSFTDDPEGGSVDIISGLYSLAMLIPSFSIGVRRLHDQNRSGWLFLVSFIPVIGSIIFFIFMLLGTVKVNNRWRMYDIQRGYIKEDIFDEPLSNNQWTYKEM